MTQEEKDNQWIEYQSTKGDRGQQRIEIFERYGVKIPRLAGMGDDDAKRVNWIYEYAMSGGEITTDLQNEMDKKGVDNIDDLINYYAQDTGEAAAGQWEIYACIAAVVIVVSVISAGIGTYAAIGMGMTVGTTTTLTVGGIIVSGAIAGAISGATMAAMNDENILKGAAMGAVTGAALSAASVYAKDIWSGFWGKLFGEGGGSGFWSAIATKSKYGFSAIYQMSRYDENEGKDDQRKKIMMTVDAASSYESSYIRVYSHNYAHSSYANIDDFEQRTTNGEMNKGAGKREVDFGNKEYRNRRDEKEIINMLHQ